jgi:hypothetical protein
MPKRSSRRTPSRPEIYKSRSDVWDIAKSLSSDNSISRSLMRDAEMTVIRRLLSKSLKNGEVEFWQLVAKALNE